MLFWPLAVIAALLIAFFAIDLAPPGAAGQDGTDWIYLAALGVLVAMAATGRLIVTARQHTLSNTLLWVGVVGGLTTAFVFREEARPIVDDLKGRLMPAVALSRAEGVAELRPGRDGQFHASAEVNGMPLTMIVDTGASMVTIPFEQAERVGIDPAALEFSIPVVTASGRSAVAPVHLASIRIGQVAVFDVEAAVAPPGHLKTALLGMTFLGRLTEASFRQGVLVLRN